MTLYRGAPSRAQRIRALRARGDSAAQIAAELQVPLSEVNRVLRRGQPRPRGRFAQPAATFELSLGEQLGSQVLDYAKAQGIGRAEAVRRLASLGLKKRLHNDLP